MRRLFDFFGRGGVAVAGRLGVFVAAAGLAGLLVLMSCGDEEASQERERISRVISTECEDPAESAGERNVDIYFLSEDQHGGLMCQGVNMVLTQDERGKASMRWDHPPDTVFAINYLQEGFRAQNRHGDGTCGRRIYTFNHHLEDRTEDLTAEYGVIWSPGAYYVEEHPDVINEEDPDEFIGFWVGTPDLVDVQANEGMLCPIYMKYDPENQNTPHAPSGFPLIPCTEEVRTKMDGRDSCLLVNDFGFPEHGTLRFDWDAALAAPPGSQQGAAPAE